MELLGIVKPGSTIEIGFNTFDSNDPSTSVTATTLLNTDCHVHKDGGTTQRTSSAGETLSLNFDGINGNHLLQLDLSDNTHNGFYTAGSRYRVRIEGATVDGGNINAWIGSFTIGYPGAIHDTTIATLATQVSFTLSAGSTNDDAYKNCIVIVHDATSAVQMAIGSVLSYTGSTKTITLDADPAIFTMAAADNISILPPTSVGYMFSSVLAAGNLKSAGEDYSTVRGLTGTAIPAVAFGNNGGLCVSDASGHGYVSDGTAAGQINTSNGVIVNVTTVGSVTGTVGSVTGSVGSVAGNVDGSVGSLAAQAKLDVNAEADAAIETYGLDHLISSALPTNWATDVASGSVFDNVADDGTAVFDRTTDSLQAIADSGGGGPTADQIADAVWDEDATAHQGAGSFGQAIGDPAANTETIYDAVVTDAAGTNVAVDLVAVAAGTTALSTDIGDLQTSTTGLMAGTTALSTMIDDVTSGTSRLETSTTALMAGTTMLSTDADDLIAGTSRIETSTTAIQAAAVSSGVQVHIDAVDAAALAADAVAEMFAYTLTELSTGITSTPTVAEVLAFQHMSAYNSHVTTATSGYDIIHNAAGSTVFLAQVTQPDANSFERARFTT